MCLAAPRLARTTCLAAGLALALRFTAGAASPPLPGLRVSADGRFLVTATGRPFFYLADTAWELLHRLDREEALIYLDKRAAQGYTAIQAVALAELEGVSEPNAYGDLPLLEKDPARAAVTPGADPRDAGQYDYWDHVDYVVDAANERGLYVALLPAWSRWVSDEKDRIFDAAGAEAYGRFLGQRYARKAIVWVLGGDRVCEGTEPVWRAMARGIATGVAGREDYDAVMMTYHPRGGRTSSACFHDDAWLDFNMHQTGHGRPETTRGFRKIAADYERTPAKPVLDGEPLYEDHPVEFKAADLGYSFDAHVRPRAYWSLLAGSFGHTYGNHSVWQMYAPGRRPINGPLLDWSEAIHRPGAAQMTHVRALFESRPPLERVPDPAMVVDPLEGADHVSAARGRDYAIVYSAQGRPFALRLGRISGEKLATWWFNPRTGTAAKGETVANAGVREFACPAQGFGADWVLVLDDAARGYGPPGQVTLERPR